MNRLYFILSVLAIFCTTALFAMPPHPALLERIRNGEQQVPYYMQNEAQLRARGIENSVAPRALRDIKGDSRDTQVPILVVCVDFDDNVHQVEPLFFDNMLFGETGSLQDYYQEVTYGNLTLMSYDPPTDLLWIRAPQDYTYYVDGQQGSGTYPNNVQRLVEDVVAIIDPVVDFSVYDGPDADQDVDGFFLLHAGPGAETSGSDNDIWSFAWATENVPNVDGVWVYSFSTEPEYRDVPGDGTFGVYAHEAGHAMFGFVDFYDRDYTSNGLGDWTLMAGGSWGGNSGDSPAHPDPYHLIQLGVINPVNVSGTVMAATIPAVENTPTVYRLWANGQQGSEYFLVENRQLIGYDISLPGTGLLIYHVDESVGSAQNDNEWYPDHTNDGHYFNALEQADGWWDLEVSYNGGDNGDPYPGINGNRDFSDFSFPNSKDYDNVSTSVMITNISDSSPLMSADFSVTGSKPLALVAERLGDDIHLSWKPMIGAASYGIYRSADINVPIIPGNLVGTVTETEYLDPLGELSGAYYVVIGNLGVPTASNPATRRPQ